MTAEDWAYVGSDMAAGKVLRFYRCPVCRAIVEGDNRDRHTDAARHTPPASDVTR